MIPSVLPRPVQLGHLILSPPARPVRFAGTGVSAGAVQLVLLTIMAHHGWDATLANGAAFLLAAQVNFVLSSTLTWRDRALPGSLRQRWLLYHGSIAAMAMVNMLAFTAARMLVPTVAASAIGIASGALGNYFAGDRLVFRAPGDRGTTPNERMHAA